MARYGPCSRPEVQPKFICCRFRALRILAFRCLFLLGGVDCAWTELPASRREGRRTDGPLGVGDHVSDLTLSRIHTSPFPGPGSAAFAIPPSTLKGPTGESYVRFTESRIWEVGGLSEDIDRSEGVDSPLQ